MSFEERYPFFVSGHGLEPGLYRERSSRRVTRYRRDRAEKDRGLYIGTGRYYNPNNPGWQLPFLVSGSLNADHPYWNEDTTYPPTIPYSERTRPSAASLWEWGQSFVLADGSNPVFVPPGERIREQHGSPIVPPQVPGDGARPYYIKPGGGQQLYWDGEFWWLRQGSQWWFFPKEPMPRQGDGEFRIPPDWLPYEPGWGYPRRWIEFYPSYYQNPFWSVPDYDIIPPLVRPASEPVGSPVRYPSGPPTRDIEEEWLPDGWERGPAWEDGVTPTEREQEVDPNISAFTSVRIFREQVAERGFEQLML